MKQLMLGLARRSDHSSSVQAAERAVRSGLVAGHEAKILDALRAVRAAMTMEQLAETTGLDGVQVARRMAALVKRGLVRRIAVDGERLRWWAR